MPSVPRAPTAPQVFRRQVHRTEDLERRTTSPDRAGGLEGAVFSVVGDMAVSTSPKYRALRGGQIVAVNFDADAAGTGTTTFDVLVNGAAVGSSVSVPSGTTESVAYIGDVRVAARSTLQIDLTAAGMHEGAVIQVVMKG